jgi:hypothetical protein
MNNQYGHVGEYVKVDTLFKKGGLAAAANNVAQAAQNYYADRMPLEYREDLGSSARQVYNDACIVAKVYGNAGVASPVVGNGIVVGVKLKIWHADEGATKELPGSFSEVNLNALYNATGLKPVRGLVGDFLELTKTTAGTGAVVYAKCNLDISRLKRFFKVVVTPVLAVGAAEDVEIVVDAVLSHSQHGATADKHQINISA